MTARISYTGILRLQRRCLNYPACVLQVSDALFENFEPFNEHEHDITVIGTPTEGPKAVQAWSLIHHFTRNHFLYQISQGEQVHLLQYLLAASFGGFNLCYVICPTTNALFSNCVVSKN